MSVHSDQIQMSDVECVENCFERIRALVGSLYRVDRQATEDLMNDITATQSATLNYIRTWPHVGSAAA